MRNDTIEKISLATRIATLRGFEVLPLEDGRYLVRDDEWEEIMHRDNYLTWAHTQMLELVDDRGEEFVSNLEQSFKDETLKLLDENFRRCKICQNALSKNGLRMHIIRMHGEEAYLDLVGDRL